jgi:hypothetical protein
MFRFPYPVSGHDHVCKPKTSGIPAAKVAATAFVLLVTLACTPTVKVATDEPITINLNVNIKHEILIKVDQELDDLFSEDSELF